MPKSCRLTALLKTAVFRPLNDYARSTRTSHTWHPQGPPSASVLYFRRYVAAVSEASVSSAASLEDLASLKDLASSSENICSMSSKMRRRSSSFATLETNPDCT